MNAIDLIKQHRASRRQAGQIATANRAKGQRTLSGAYLGFDATTGEEIRQLPNGETVRTKAINTAYVPPGAIAPIRAAKGGRGVSDGKHAS